MAKYVNLLESRVDKEISTGLAERLTSRTYHVLRGRVYVVVNAPRERAVDNVHRQADLRPK